MSLDHAIVFELWLKNDLEKNPQAYADIIEVKHFKLLTELHEDALNYAIQLYFKGLPQQEIYVNTGFKNLLARLDLVLAGKYVYFPTTLQQF